MKDFKKVDKKRIKEVKKEAENQFKAFEQWIANHSQIVKKIINS